MAKAAQRRRGRPEAQAGDYGPQQRLDNGTAVLVYRADPDRPNAPAMRAAKAYVAYETLMLPDASREAADRILMACEAVTGAREFNGGGLGGRAFWQVGGPSAAQYQAAKWLRELAAVVGRRSERAVLELVVNGKAEGEDLTVAVDALADMGLFWEM